MKTYKNKETREIKTYEDIRREHNELINNSSIDIEDIHEIKDIDNYISEYYDEIDIEADERRLEELKEEIEELQDKINELKDEGDVIMGNYPIGYFDYLF